MNRIIEDFRRDDERILDRLVDGELTEEDRKSLLAALDDEPGSWRRCALAFLEAQSWRGDFRAVREEAKPRPEPATPQEVIPAPRPVRSSRFFELCLAVAACVVMAFGFGAWMRGTEKAPSGLPHSESLAGTKRTPEALLQRPVHWHRAKLNYDDPSTQGPDNIELPVRDVKNLTEDHLRHTPSALPESMRQTLEKSGHRVIQRQQLVPIPLKGGGHLMVPVEQVDVEPNNRPAY